MASNQLGFQVDEAREVGQYLWARAVGNHVKLTHQGVPSATLVSHKLSNLGRALTCKLSKMLT